VLVLELVAVDLVVVHRSFTAAVKRPNIEDEDIK
jgi:hypothetical protein